MRLPRLSVSRKLAISYIIVAVTSLVAVAYALTSLREQTANIGDLVHQDFRALSLARELRANVLAQEALEKQYLIHRDIALLQLLGRRQAELDTKWAELEQVADGDSIAGLAKLIAAHRAAEIPEGSDATGALAPARSDIRAALVNELEVVRDDERSAIDASLQKLSDRSLAAYRWTLFLVLGGLLLGAPVALSIAWSIHTSVRRLKDAVRDVSAGRYEAGATVDGDDEFGALARDFAVMSRKLAELQKDNLDANPLTYLPGNRAIDREMTTRIDEDKAFAHAYVDLDHFKAYNDRYGYAKGSDAIAAVGRMIREVVAEHGRREDLVGHVGGDDYIVLTEPERAESIAQQIIDRFEQEKDNFYSAEDKEAGHFLGVDRYGVKRKLPLMSMSIAIVSTDNFKQPSPTAIARECATIKEHLKAKPGSNYLIDRRSRD